MGPGKDAFAPGAQQGAVLVEHRDGILPAIEGVDIPLLSMPTAATSPSTIASGIFAQFSSTSKVHSPMPSRSAIISSRSCGTIIGRACLAWGLPGPRGLHCSQQAAFTSRTHAHGQFTA